MVVSGALAAAVMLTSALASVVAPGAHVRGSDDRMVALINTGTARSTTFRALVNQIGKTDGIVYIADGRCPRGVRACLLWTISAMGPYRVLRILVDARDPDPELTIGSIGHELHHALELLSRRRITTDSEIALLYHRIGSVRGLAVETNDAVKAGDAVREELRHGRER
jgi:hypothetical protein